MKTNKKITLVYHMGELDKKETKRLNKKPYKSLKETIERRKRAERDARLVKFF